MTVPEVLVGFGRALRDHGLPVGTGQVMSFCRAVVTLDPLTRDDLYWAARSTLTSSKHHLELFDRLFDSYFGADRLELIESGASMGDPEASIETEESYELDLDAAGWTLPGDAEETEGDVAVGLVASRAEMLRDKSFEDLSEEELDRAQALIRRLAVAIPHRRSRRLYPSRKGQRFDLRRTLRYSLRTQGEPFRRAHRNRRTKARSLVLLLDVSGSMSPYARALLQFGFAAMAAGHKVEVFCFGTRLTRVTRSLQTKNPDRALRDVSHIVSDWDGGTRIGDSLRELLSRYGQHGFLRGSVVILCSDGLERGDPDLLAAQMLRLTRLAHRVVWVNPLKGSPAYEPLARGMAASLPHIDLFLPGHNLASLEELGKALSG